MDALPGKSVMDVRAFDETNIGRCDRVKFIRVWTVPQKDDVQPMAREAIGIERQFWDCYFYDHREDSTSDRPPPQLNERKNQKLCSAIFGFKKWGVLSGMRNAERADVPSHVQRGTLVAKFLEQLRKGRPSYYQSNRNSKPPRCGLLRLSPHCSLVARVI
jgi:hypothetical protein